MDFFKKEQLILHGVTGWMIGKLTGLIWSSTYAAVTVYCTGGACINANVLRWLVIFFIKHSRDEKVEEAAAVSSLLYVRAGWRNNISY